jgi:hypothetical protein
MEYSRLKGIICFTLWKLRIYIHVPLHVNIYLWLPNIRIQFDQFLPDSLGFMVIKQLCLRVQKITFGTSNSPWFFNSRSVLLRLEPLNETLVPTTNCMPPLDGIQPEVVMSGVWSRLAAEGWIVVQIYWKPIRKFETAVTWSKYQDRIAQGWRLWL